MFFCGTTRKACFQSVIFPPILHNRLKNYKDEVVLKEKSVDGKNKNKSFDVVQICPVIFEKRSECTAVRRGRRKENRHFKLIYLQKI